MAQRSGASHVLDASAAMMAMLASATLRAERKAASVRPQEHPSRAGTFAGTRQFKTEQDGAKARNGRPRTSTAINTLRLADFLRTRGSWVQILPGAPIPSST